jgi:hypothetical protein
MQKDLIHSAFVKINSKVFFLLLFLYQLFFIPQGLELGDAGFNVTLYQQIFNDPHSVQYGFPFWFTGVVGSAWTHILPSSFGLLGIRLGGVVVIMLSIILSYNLLKNYLGHTYLKIGLLLIVVFSGNDPKELYYNNLSPFLYILATICLFTGLKENNPLKIFVCGLILSLNTFARLPNILGLSMALAIFYNGYLQKNSLKKQIGQIAILLLGFTVTTIIVLFIMKMIGHLDIYISSLKVLMNMANTGEKSPYDAAGLLSIYAKTYIECILYSTAVVGLILATIYTINLVYKKVTKPAWLPKAFVYLVIVLFFIALVMKGKLYFMLYLFTGASLITAVSILIGKKSDEYKLITFISALLLFIFPLGSFQGILTAGYFSFWLIFPIIIDHLFSIKKIEASLSTFTNTSGYSLNLSVSKQQLYHTKQFIVSSFIIICVYTALLHPFLDISASRTKMIYPVKNKLTNGIYTSDARAKLVNELLDKIGEYAKPNDYLLCYPFIPMVHYLTETRPFMGNPYTGMYSAGIFNTELSKSVVNKKILPVIVTQKINPFVASAWPFTQEDEEEDYTFVNIERDQHLKDFIQKNQYKEVLSNQVFSIFVPPTTIIP